MKANPIQRPALSTLLFMLIGVAWNIWIWTDSLKLIWVGQFTELSSRGGFPIGIVSAAHNPLKFWVNVAMFPVVGSVFLSLGARRIVLEMRHRRALERLTVWSELRRKRENPPPEHESFRPTPWRHRPRYLK